MNLWHNIRMVLSLTCEESSRLLSNELDRTLLGPERIALRLHLVLCRHCRRFERNLRIFRRLLGHMNRKNLSGDGLGTPLTPEAKARIVEKVTQAQSEEFS